MQRRFLTLPDVLALLAAIAVLVFIASNGRLAFHSTGQISHYGTLARAFVSGRIDFGPLMEPAGLHFATDATALADAVRTNGHTYSLCGPFPALFAYAPSIAVFGFAPPDSLVAVVLWIIATLFWSSLVIRVCGIYWVRYPFVVRSSIIAVIGLGNLAPAVISQPSAWHIAWHGVTCAGLAPLISRTALARTHGTQRVRYS